MSHVPRLTERYDRLVELVFRNDPALAKFRVYGAYNLNTAFTAANQMFDVPNAGTYRSAGIRSRRLGHTQYHNRGLSRAIYDPEDFWSGGSTLPHDSDIAFLRVAGVDRSGTEHSQGPILAIPPPNFFTTPRPMLTVAGTAPNVAATSSGIPPAGALHFYTPRFFDYVAIRNKEAGGGTSIFLSFGRGLPEIEVPAGEVKDVYDAADNEILIRGDSGTAAFDAQFALVNGEMG